MTGAEHYAEAERLLADATNSGQINGAAYSFIESGQDLTIAAAQVHATLALAYAAAAATELAAVASRPPAAPPRPSSWQDSSAEPAGGGPR